jgi:hypothetical protein
MWACVGAKGGVGTTTVAVGCALAARHPSRPVVLVDFAGDLPAVLGVAEPVLGVTDWLCAGDDVSLDSLRRLEVDCGHGVHLLARGGAEMDGRRVGPMLALLSSDHRPVVMDLGLATADVASALLAHRAVRPLLVVRPCYLALRRAQRMLQDIAFAHRPEVILVDEPGRALGASDIAAALDLSVTRVGYDLGVARSIDAGLLLARSSKKSVRALDEIVGLVARGVDR